MSVEECYRKAEKEKKLAQKQARASGLMLGGQPVKIGLNQGRVFVKAFGQTTSKLFWTDKRARKYFEKLVEKYELEVQSSEKKEKSP